MSDGPTLASRIGLENVWVTDPDETEIWRTIFDCTEQELTDAIKVAGCRVELVEAYLSCRSAPVPVSVLWKTDSGD